jgi:hypothetical protein
VKAAEVLARRMRAGGNPDSNLLPLTLLLALPFAPEIAPAILGADATGAVLGARTIAALRTAWPKIKDVVTQLPRFARSASNQSGLSFDEFLKEIQTQLNHPTTPPQSEIGSAATSIALETTDQPNEPIEPRTPESVLKSARQRLVDAKLDHLTARPDNAEPTAAQRTPPAKTFDGEVGFDSFEDFKDTFGRFGRDNAWHHIVGQHQSNIDKFGEHAIHSTSNLIRLPKDVHDKLSGFYNSRPKFAGGLIPDFKAHDS